MAVKPLVRTAANTSAWITGHHPERVVVRFSDTGPFAGLVIVIGTTLDFQLPLPLFKSDQIRSVHTIGPPVAQNLR